MPAKTYKVSLTKEERDHLENITSSGTEKVRKLTRVRILLKADQGWTDQRIAEALDSGHSTIERVRKNYVEKGLAAAINRKPTSRQYKRKLDGREEAHLVALVCGTPPEGHGRWSLRLLAEQFVVLEQVEIESISHETIRQVLKKTNLSLGETKHG